MAVSMPRLWLPSNAENDKIASQREALVELEAHVVGLQAQLKREDAAVRV